MKRLVLLITLVAILSLLFAACSGKQSGTAAEVADSDVVIEKTAFNKTALFIPVTVEGTKMEVIAVKAPDGTLRTALNTCQVCFDSGRGYYKQDGDVLVCQNCGTRFKMNQISVERGGCNPIGISEDMRIETDDTITVPLDLLKEAVPFFGNWKKS